MARWTSDQLEKFGRAEEVQIGFRLGLDTRTLHFFDAESELALL